MQLPPFLQGEAPARLIQGAIGGAIVTLVVGFYWGGWVTGGSAKEMVQKSTSAAVVTALAPICVDKFERSADSGAKLTELKKISSWQQGSYVEKGGWATMPGSDTANSSVAEACARMLGELKK